MNIIATTKASQFFPACVFILHTTLPGDHGNQREIYFLKEAWPTLVGRQTKARTGSSVLER